jgi:hypothetical protein
VRAMAQEAHSGLNDQYHYPRQQQRNKRGGKAWLRRKTERR